MNYIIHNIKEGRFFFDSFMLNTLYNGSWIIFIIPGEEMRILSAILAHAFINEDFDKVDTTSFGILFAVFYESGTK